MNIEDYISTGILEAYALGELTDEERREVQINLVKFPELQAELQLIEQTQEELLIQMSLNPSPRVKSLIFQTSEVNSPAGKVVSSGPSTAVGFWKLAAAASVAVALLATYLAYDYRARWMSTTSDLNTLIAQNQRMAQDYNQVNRRLDRIEHDLKIMDNPDVKRVVMRGTENAPGSMAFVYWNESTQEVFLSIQKMKELSQENQYQLWAIIDGKPVDAGVFDGNVAGLLQMKKMAKGASMFAVTIEPRGGKSSPTLHTMQMAGNMSKS